MESSDLPWYQKGSDYLDIFIRVTPHARSLGVKLDLTEPRSHKVKIGVNVPPEGGKANKAVIELLSDVLKYRKTAFHLQVGATRRDKTIRIMGNPDLLLENCLASFETEKTK